MLYTSARILNGPPPLSSVLRCACAFDSMIIHKTKKFFGISRLILLQSLHQPKIYQTFKEIKGELGDKLFFCLCVWLKCLGIDSFIWKILDSTWSPFVRPKLHLLFLPPTLLFLNNDDQNRQEEETQHLISHQAIPNSRHRKLLLLFMLMLLLLPRRPPQMFYSISQGKRLTIPK